MIGETDMPVSSNLMGGRGIVTLAYGRARYLRMARVLAASLRLHCDHIPRAIITDSRDPDLLHLYHLCIPLRQEYGGGLQQKLSLDRYSPFEQTLFIDSDCLVVRDISSFWSFFSGAPVGVVGSSMRDGYWFGDIARIRGHFGLESIPRFNGGLVYFERSDRAARIFATAREIMDGYETLGFRPLLRGGRNEEPVLAFALSVHGVEGLDDGGATMRTPIGLRGGMEIDVLRGYCRFRKEGTLVEPAIAHFCGWYARGFYYQRERLKLYLACRSPLPRRIISLGVDAVCNPSHAVIAALAGPPLRVLTRTYRRWKAREVR